MAPEENLMHEGASIPQEGPIDPLAKFNRVIKVISGLSPDSKKMNQLQAKKFYNTALPL